MRFVTTELQPSFELLDVFFSAGELLWSRHGEGLVAWGESARIDVPCGSARDHAVAEVLGTSEHEGTLGGPIAFVSLTFDRDAAGSVAIVPEYVVGKMRGRAWATHPARRHPPPPPPPRRAQGAPMRIRYAGSSVSEVAWLESVAAAISEIGSANLEKVVLARDLQAWSESPLDDRVLAEKLAGRFPQCFTFVCDRFIGASPELLVKRTSDVIESVVLAGSARRGENEEDDVLLGKELLASAKERLEHRLALDSVRAPLEKISDHVIVDPSPTLLRLDNAQHLATRLHARSAHPADALTIAEALHPTAAVCGSPTEEALRFIRAREGMERGRYAGPIGWVNANGDGEFAIALRCAEIGSHRARLFAGAGLVRGSMPEAELEETRLKLRAMQGVLGDATGPPLSPPQPTPAGGTGRWRRAR